MLKTKTATIAKLVLVALMAVSIMFVPGQTSAAQVGLSRQVDSSRVDSFPIDHSQVDHSKVLTVVATAYRDSYEDNYPFGGQPSYTGLPLERGVIATDPNVIPMGTHLYVEGYGEAIAADQGNAIKGNRIDLFFDTKQEVNNWGVRTVKVHIVQGN